MEGEKRRFLVEAIRNFRETGAIAPSSPQLSRLMAEESALGEAKVVVELGPGSGAFTPDILEGMAPGASYLGIEINPAFVEELRANHPGADFVAGSAEEIGNFLRERGHDACDRVVSGIPWMSLDEELRERMIGAVAEAIVPGGRFVTFSYFPLAVLPRGKAFKKLLETHFSKVEVSDVVAANLPPAFAYVCTR